MANHLFRIAQEAVNNSRHGQAAKVEVSLDCDGKRKSFSRLKMTGKGFADSKKRLGGIGLQIMQHRATVIGARLEIDSREDKGVAIVCRLDLPK